MACSYPAGSIARVIAGADGAVNERPVTKPTPPASARPRATSGMRRRRWPSALPRACADRLHRRGFLVALPQVAGALDDPCRRLRDIADLQAGARRPRDAERRADGRRRRRAVRRLWPIPCAMRPWWFGGRERRARGAMDRLKVFAARASWRDGDLRREAVSGDGRSRLQAAQALDCATWLPNDLLTKLDRCLMAHGLEGRTPFLDPEVAEALLTCPTGMKVRGRYGQMAAAPAIWKTWHPAPVRSGASGASPCRWRNGSAAAAARWRTWWRTRRACRRFVMPHKFRRCSGRTTSGRGRRYGHCCFSRFGTKSTLSAAAPAQRRKKRWRGFKVRNRQARGPPSGLSRESGPSGCRAPGRNGRRPRSSPVPSAAKPPSAAVP